MPNINEQEIRDYLLGSLSPERQAQIEFHIRSDADLSEEVIAVEEELIDQYLAQDLSDVERQLFETNFLTSTERQRRLDFGRVFKQYRESYSPPLAPALEREETSASPRVPAPDIAPPMRISPPVFPPFNRNPACVVLLIVLAGLIIMATAWLFTTRPPAHVDTIPSASSQNE